jgi:ATP-dependent RNA helicase DeaD
VLLEQGDLDGYRVVTDALAGEFDPLDVAAAAVKLAHQAQQADAAQDEEHIPTIDPRAARETWSKKGKSAWSSDRAARAASGQGGERHGAAPAAAPGAPGRHKSAGSKGRPAGRPPTMVRVFVGAGRNAGLRPADLVGAIANEAGVSAREIGAIEIEERFALVEVSDHIAEDAIRALRNTSLRGQRVTVRRDQPKRATK